jgi:hypothetical protein
MASNPSLKLVTLGINPSISLKDNVVIKSKYDEGNYIYIMDKN